MSLRISDSATDYGLGLASYVETPEERWLGFAYEFGRRALAEGLGLLDIVTVHEATLRELLMSSHDRYTASDIALRAGLFLGEALGPFEMAYRGFRDANLALQDANERLAAQTSRLQEINTELDSFAHSVAHDLRAPLRSMQGFSQALLEDHADQLGEEGRRHAERVVGAARRMDQLILDLLAYSRMSRSDLRPSMVDVAIVVGDARALLAEELDERGAEVLIAADLPRVMADPSLLRTVIANLIDNGAKFVEPGVRPVIRVAAEQRADRVRVTVQDNGIGIAPEHGDRIFRMLERLHSVDQYPGSGIGLAIVRRAIERMGGTVGLTSERGSGSTFWIELPAARR